MMGPRRRYAAPALLLAALSGVAACSDDTNAAAEAVAATDAAAPQQEPTPQEPPMAEPPMMSDPAAMARDTCDAELAKPAAMGKPATAERLEQARLDAGASTVRVLKPGQMVTMEFLAGRLNVDVDVDDSNTIVNLRCG